jgi:hypothetical protein
VVVVAVMVGDVFESFIMFVSVKMVVLCNRLCSMQATCHPPGKPKFDQNDRFFAKKPQVGCL